MTLFVLDPTWTTIWLIMHGLCGTVILVSCLMAVRHPVLRREFVCFTVAAALGVLRLALCTPSLLSLTMPGDGYGWRSELAGWGLRLEIPVLLIFCAGFVFLTFRLLAWTASGRPVRALTAFAAPAIWAEFDRSLDLWVQQWGHTLCVTVVLTACLLATRHPFFRTACVALGLGALATLSGEVLFRWQVWAAKGQWTIELFNALSDTLGLQTLGLIFFAAGFVLLANRVRQLSSLHASTT